jgi:hypothetical protein
MDAHNFNLFLLLLLGAIVIHAIAPIYGAALVALVYLCLYAWSPAFAIGLAVLWVLRWFVVDFFLALIGGFGAGLGFRAAMPRRSLRSFWRVRGGRFRRR